MTDLSRSPLRGSFQAENYRKRKEEMGEDPNPEYEDLFKSFEQHRVDKEQDPEWPKDNLEYDLRTTDWILEKVRSSESYAQNLYAALCNNEFQKREVMPILTDKKWSCSWRYAGGIIADMRQEGDYIDWYCSGIRGDQDSNDGFVPESIVTEEIEADLLKLGWNTFKYGETDQDI